MINILFYNNKKEDYFHFNLKREEWFPFVDFLSNNCIYLYLMIIDYCKFRKMTFIPETEELQLNLDFFLVKYKHLKNNSDATSMIFNDRFEEILINLLEDCKKNKKTYYEVNISHKSQVPL